MENLEKPEAVKSCKDAGTGEPVAWPEALRSAVHHRLNELMMSAENYFGAENPKREGHIWAQEDALLLDLANIYAAPPTDTFWWKQFDQSYQDGRAEGYKAGWKDGRAEMRPPLKGPRQTPEGEVGN